MGTVVVFAEARRAPPQNPPPVQAGAAIVVILPVVRIERDGARSSVSSLPRRNSKPSSGRKRRKRATPS